MIGWDGRGWDGLELHNIARHAAQRGTRWQGVVRGGKAWYAVWCACGHVIAWHGMPFVYVAIGGVRAGRGGRAGRRAGVGRVMDGSRGWGLGAPLLGASIGHVSVWLICLCVCFVSWVVWLLFGPIGVCLYFRACVCSGCVAVSF